MFSPGDLSWKAVRLGPADGDLYCEHLLRLDPEDRRFRFFDDPPDYLLALHAGAAVSDGRFVIACESRGEIRGAGELLPDADDPARGELAFSVEREWRRRGLGGAIMGLMLGEARRRGMSHLDLEIMADNLAMQNLVRRFTADLHRSEGNVVATIAVDPA
jgi:GNAT superfamily N-acetyltransferase